MSNLKLSLVYKLLLLLVLPLFLFYLLPSFTKPSLAACDPTACAAKGSPSYACQGVSTCEQLTWGCRGNPPTCTFASHAPAAQNLCCPGGGTCSNGSCSTGTTCASQGANAGCKTATVCSTEGGSNVGTFNCTSGNICCVPAGGGGGGSAPPPTTQSGGCPVCATGGYDPITKTCYYQRDSGTIVRSNPTITTCSQGQLCYPGCGCNKPCSTWANFSSGRLPCGTDGSCPTAVGQVSAAPQGIVPTLFRVLLVISGAIALLLIILSGYRLIASQGNPEQVQTAREQLTAAVVGLLFIIFSFVILRFIGIDILGIFR